MSPMKSPAAERRDELGDSLSLAAVARELRVPAKEVRHLLAERRLDFVQICGQLRVPRAALARYRDQQALVGE
ncbi:MAG: DNA-binding protein [Planctomycetota bacterium]|nr:MAG: DNA-binding protein [Planctomycetota bacterium]REJ94445.1 MAG: DNA-binding protein [Planctomycetota bacterium]REK22020.1 MAG: DNA-binding protein [Planctomycetota bacterium]REK44428.1 MAG: DNA-binding protein [Planctomycetota bacterium]